MTARIQTRRDTSANWTSNNPTLAEGEQGFDTTEQKLKVGDGVTAWNSLDYVSGAGGLSNDSIQRVAAFTAEADAEYFLKTDAGTFEVELPVGAPGVRIKLLDSTGFWSANPPTVVDNGGTGFNGVADSPLELNVGGSWIEFIYNSDDSHWEVMGPQAIDETLSIEYSEQILSADFKTDGEFFSFPAIVGRQYELTGMVLMRGVVADPYMQVYAKDDAIVLAKITMGNDEGDNTYPLSTGVFTATTSTIIVRMDGGNANAYVRGTGDRAATWAQLKEVRSLQTEVAQIERISLTSNVNVTTATSINEITILEKTNLVVGRTYKVSGSIFPDFLNAATAVYINLVLKGADNGTGEEPFFQSYKDTANTSLIQASMPFSATFVATGTFVRLVCNGRLGVDNVIQPTAGLDRSFMDVEEVRPLESITTATATVPGLLPSYEEETGNLNGDFSGGTYKAVRIGSTVTVTLMNPVWSGGGFSAIYSTVLIGNNFRPVASAYQTSDPRASVAIVGVNATGRLEMLLRSPTNLNAAKAENSAAMSSSIRTYSISYNV